MLLLVVLIESNNLVLLVETDINQGLCSLDFQIRFADTLALI